MLITTVLMSIVTPMLRTYTKNATEYIPLKHGLAYEKIMTNVVLPNET